MQKTKYSNGERVKTENEKEIVSNILSLTFRFGALARAHKLGTPWMKYGRFCWSAEPFMETRKEVVKSQSKIHEWTSDLTTDQVGVFLEKCHWKYCMRFRKELEQDKVTWFGNWISKYGILSKSKWSGRQQDGVTAPLRENSIWKLFENS